MTVIQTIIEIKSRANNVSGESAYIVFEYEEDGFVEIRVVFHRFNLPDNKISTKLCGRLKHLSNDWAYELEIVRKKLEAALELFSEEALNNSVVWTNMHRIISEIEGN